MVDFDELRAKAEDFLEDHAEQVDGGIDKAAEFAAKKYGHAQQIDTGADKLKDFLPGDDTEDSPAEQAAGTGQPGPRKAPGGQGRSGQPGRGRQQGRAGQEGRRGAGRRPGPGH